MEREIPLTGGRTTTGVVRVGNTVRRPINGRGSLAHELFIIRSDLDSTALHGIHWFWCGADCCLPSSRRKSRLRGV